MPRKKTEGKKDTAQEKTEISKQKVVDLLIKKLNKNAPDGLIRVGTLGAIVPKQYNVIPTGSIALDMALGVGGYPEGRIIEIFGAESSGKTSLALHAVAEAQKLGKVCAFVDVEHSLDPVYAESIGVDIDGLLFSQPSDGDEAMRIIDTLARSGAVSLIILDSVAGLVPAAEMESEITDNHIGRQARLMSQALRRLTTVCGETKCTIIFINQIRNKIGVMYGSPEVTAGGNALKFYATMRLDVRRKEPIKEKDNIIGAVTRVKVVKNKVAPPFRQALFNIMYGKGIDKDADIVAVAVDMGIIERRGAWYYMNDEQITQGTANLIEYIKENNLSQSIREQILKIQNAQH